jgi:hypothetical protein
MVYLTHGCYYLSFEAILVGESSSKIAYSTVSIASHIRDLSNMIKHVATGEKEYGN